MPWFPDFANAAELARRATRSAGRADPVTQYLAALHDGDVHGLETVWPGTVVVHDPRAGQVRGHRQLRRYIARNKTWLGDRRARIETVHSTCMPGRAVVELLAHLPDDDGEVDWPIAVVAESPDERSVEFRIYCSQRPVDGRSHLRPAVLEPRSVHVADPIGGYLAAEENGDVDAAVKTFAPDGYFREPTGRHALHRGTGELHTFFTGRFGGGGVFLQPCQVTDDGIRCAVEYTCVRWGGHDLPPQAGIGVYERTAGGSLLAAARAYDDVVAPVGHG
jgi:ketosteroid isomerase-like protein